MKKYETVWKEAGVTKERIDTEKKKVKKEIKED